MWATHWSAQTESRDVHDTALTTMDKSALGNRALFKWSRQAAATVHKGGSAKTPLAAILFITKVNMDAWIEASNLFIYIYIYIWICINLFIIGYPRLIIGFCVRCSLCVFLTYVCVYILYRYLRYVVWWSVCFFIKSTVVRTMSPST